MKGIYQRGGIFWFRMTVPGHGQRRVSLGTDDEAVAIGKARDFIDRPALLLYNETFSAEVDAYIAAKRAEGVSLSTLTKYETVLAAFLRDLDEADPRRLTRARIEGWLTAKRKECSERTVAEYIGFISRFFRWMEGRGLRNNPCQGIPVPKLAMQPRKRFLTPAEARKLLTRCRDKELKFALYCALHAGLRKGEVIQARPEWFDLRAGLLHVQNSGDWQTKDRTNRTIPLTREFLAFLKTYGKPSPFMLAPAVRQGRYRYRYEFRKPFMALLARCKIPGATFHDLRRTFASLAVSRGVSLYKVAKWLGDGSSVVERTYGHLLPNDDQINAAWEDVA